MLLRIHHGIKPEEATCHRMKNAGDRHTMINILYLFVTLPIGGAEEHLLTLLRNLNLSCFNPTVCCIRDKGTIGREIEKHDFRVISLERKSKLPDFRILNDIRKIIRTKNIHIIHSHLYHANMYGRIAAFFANIPVIATEHSVDAHTKLKRQLINRFLARKTSKIIAVSHMVKARITERDQIDPAKIDVIYNGIDTNHFCSSLSKEKAREKLGIPAESLVIGTVGRLEKPKGHIHLIHAMQKVTEQNPNTKLIIVGTGSLESPLKSEVARQGIGHSVIFLGLRRDIPDILMAFDIFVMPSLSEGFPMALLEAMSLALPVIVTPVGGIPELVTDEINGIFVPPANEPALAKKILDLSADRSRLTRLGNSGKAAIFEKFSASAMVQAIEVLYKSVLS